MPDIDDAPLQSAFLGADPIEDDDVPAGISDDDGDEGFNVSGQEKTDEGTTGEVVEESGSEGEPDSGTVGTEGDGEPAGTEGEVDAKGEVDGAGDAPVVDDPGTDPAADPEPKPAATESVQIPKARLDREVARRRALENEIKDLQAKAAGVATPDASGKFSVPTVDIAEAGKGMFDKVLDGDLDGATAALSSIIQSAVQSTADHMGQQVDQRVEAHSSKSAFDVAVDEIQTQYDVLDINSDNYNPDLTAQVNAMTHGYQQMNFSEADALRMAAEDTMKLAGIDTGAATEAGEAPAAVVAPKVTPRAIPVAKNLAADKASPPRLEGQANVEVVAEDIKIDDLTDEEYDALPVATQKRLRGD